MKPTLKIEVLSDRIPKTLGDRAIGLRECIRAFADVLPVERVVLFGSYSNGRNKKDSDIDLCLIVSGIKSQQEAARTLRRAIGRIRNKPAMSLVPISPERLAEKRRVRDPFFETIMREGVCLAEKN